MGRQKWYPSLVKEGLQRLGGLFIIRYILLVLVLVEDQTMIVLENPEMLAVVSTCLTDISLAISASYDDPSVLNRLANRMDFQAGILKRNN